MAQYEGFKRLKQRDFEVKLRQVGNSWSVSIPKEIIQFEAVKATKFVRLSLDNPGKVSISFTQIKKNYKQGWGREVTWLRNPLTKRHKASGKGSAAGRGIQGHRKN